MQYVYTINSSFTVTSLLDLPLLRDIMEACNLKPNYSLLGRELGYDRRTIKSHYENGTPDPHRHKPSMIDAFYDIIQTLLSDDTPQQFYYKCVLWQYLVDNHGLTAAYSSFRGYISKIPVFQSYFDRKHTSPSTQHMIRFGTAPAEQAQVDWKENIKFLLHDGTHITFNILLMTLGYSRYKLAKVTFDRTTETLQDALVEFVEQLQGVPHVLVTDNMKTVMVQPRLAGTKGQLHTKAEQFSSDFGFTFKPCIARRPQTEGKVESQMKILDEIHVYQGKLTIQEVTTLNDGLKFQGDMGDTSNVKLNKQVNITGGVTSAADLATGNNISVTSAAVGVDGNAKLQLQLAKNLTGLQSVTASDTVKAGTATVGNHTVADKKGGNQTGNFVTGLDNRAWDISDPTYVEGRAATEDQLKKVSNALKASNASATDYRLIANPNNAADGSYKVENNQVDLKVKDEKSSDVITVTIKNIASKTELDKVKDRSVKYDGNTGHDTVTLEGPNGTKITNLKDGNVAAGSKDAVNGGQLHDAKNKLNTNINNMKTDFINTGLKFDANVGGVQTNKLGSTVTIQGEGKAADADYSGENIKTFIKQDAATGNTTIDVKMNKNLIADTIKVNKNGKDGKDGVGHIGLTGPAGTNGVNGTNGIDLSVKPGYNDAATGVKGEKGVDGTNGLTRIVYTDGNGEHQVATMEDGLQFTGNNTGTVNKQKLNSLVKV